MDKTIKRTRLEDKKNAKVSKNDPRKLRILGEDSLLENS